MSGIFQSTRQSRHSHRSGLADSSSPNEAGSSIDEQPSDRSDGGDDSDNRPVLIQSGGECRLMRAFNEVLGCNSRMCSTGCLYSMDELIPTGYLLLIDEQNNAWFRMHLSARSQPVQLWFADFSARLQESLDSESRGRLFTSSSKCHVFAGAKRQTPGAPLHCRRFAYLPAEVLSHPSLMLHHLPISPDQLLLVDHENFAAAYVPVVVVVAKQSVTPASSVAGSDFL